MPKTLISNYNLEISMSDLFKIANEIKHLSHSEIEDLYRKYLEGTKNSALIEEYKIDIDPNKLIRILPPITLEDSLCPYCKTPMFKNRRSKSGIDSNPIECYTCDHKISPYQGSFNFRSCSCKNCLSIKEQERINTEEKKRSIIRNKYSLKDIQPIHYEKLNFFHKLVLLTLFRMQTNEEFNYILSLDDPSRTESLSPTEQMDIECLKDLFNIGALAIDPESRIDAFLEEEEFNSFYLTGTRWIPNVTLNGIKRADLPELYNETYNELSEGINPDWATDIFNTLFKISREEVLKYVYIKTDELRIDFTAENKTREVVNQLLHNFSVSEIYYFVQKSVENAHIYYAKGYANNKKHAANTIPNKILSLGERAQNEGWNTYKYSRDSRANRSYLSKIFYDFFLRDEDSGFNKSPGKQWEQELYPRYFCDKDTATKRKLKCTQCNSEHVEITMRNQSLEVECQDCGQTNEFIQSA